MMRSMYSGVSGLRVHQTKMDVIGNNIANVNTVGFKSSSVSFSDILYQTSSSASGPNSTNGTSGINAKQIGLGTNLASITTAVTKTGGSQRTDNPFDLMIEGDAFFVVNNGTTNLFTKAGSFNIDARGTLCTPTGATVMGWQPNPNDPSTCIRDIVSPIRIMSPENMFSPPVATTNMHLTGNLDSKDTALTTSGVTINVPFYDNIGNYYNAVLKITQEEEDLGDGEMPGQFTVKIADITSSDGKSIFIIEDKDDTGKTIYRKNEAYNTISFGLDGAEEDITPEVEDESVAELTGMIDQTGIKLVFNSATAKFMSLSADGTVDPDAEPINSLKLLVNCTPNPFEKIDIDFSLLTMYNESGNTSIEPGKGTIDTGAGAGKRVGNLSDVSVDTYGMIYGAYDNGDSRLLGQIAVTTFPNAAGLEAVGNNMFATTANSGDFDGIGRNIASTGGKFNNGVLEMSNVDLSQEFTDMITTQRGFQANSRIITTSDTLLEELINLKR